jgi:hypothetical protein
LPLGDGGDAAGSFAGGGTRRQMFNEEETRKDRSWACASFSELVHDSRRLYDDYQGYFGRGGACVPEAIGHPATTWFRSKGCASLDTWTERGTWIARYKRNHFIRK